MNPTATSRSYGDIDGDGEVEDEGWEWYYKDRLESIASRDGMTILSANLEGYDGPEDDYNFPGGSVIMQGAFNGPKYYAGAEDAEKQANGEELSYYSDVTDGPKAAVVNMPGIWGDKEANKEAMIEYIKEAGEQGVDILVFPETVLTGYEWKQPEDDPFYAEYGVAMQVALAETIPGDTTNELSEYAKQYGMYIIFGMTEKEEMPIYDEGVEKVYNAAAILYPDGSIDSYRKIHRAGYEVMWSVCGDEPYIIDTEWGKAGIDICRDGHFYPELGRYYAASGCTLFIHPTATTGNPWYRETRIGSYTDRDGMAAITCNLLGGDGTYIGPQVTRAADSIPDITDEEYWKQENWTGGVFNSTSLIITKYHDPETGRTGVNPETGYAIDLNGTGSESQGFAERGTSPMGLEIADMDLSGCGFRIVNFNAALFSKMYDKLALLYREGYESLYGDNAVADYVTKKLTETPQEPEVPQEPETPQNPEVPQKPETPQESETPQGAEPVQQVTQPEKESQSVTAAVEPKSENVVQQAPATGDTAGVAMLAVIMAAAGFADFAFQKWKFKDDMKMTKQEVKDEYKNQEGDPKVKSQQKARMRQASQRRMMQQLPKADVVITNPTHFAVALMYDTDVANAPIVIAKGEDYLAQKIKAKARESQIEIVENKPLARALYQSTDIGEEVPEELYQAVAEVLAYVYNLKNKTVTRD